MSQKLFCASYTNPANTTLWTQEQPSNQHDAFVLYCQNSPSFIPQPTVHNSNPRTAERVWEAPQHKLLATLCLPHMGSPCRETRNTTTTFVPRHPKRKISNLPACNPTTKKARSLYSREADWKIFYTSQKIRQTERTTGSQASLTYSTYPIPYHPPSKAPNTMSELSTLTCWSGK